MTDDLVFEQRVELHYRRSVGPVQRAFLEGLSEGRLLASTDGDRRHVPARPFAPDGSHLREIVEAPPRGTVVAVSRAHHLPGAPVFGLIRIDGSDTPMLHLLEAELPEGTIVAPVWEPGSLPGIRALRSFGAV